MIEISQVDIRDAFFDEVYDFAAKDENVIFITADTDAFSLRRYEKDLPEQFINVGVAEQNMIAVAAGLALSGKKIFIYAIIPFITLRCYEHIKVNVCSMNLPITIVGSSAGLSIAYNGPTHHAVCDVSIMRTLPEMTILNPADPATASASAHMAYKLCRPAYIRLDKGQIPAIYDDSTDFSLGLSVLKSGSDLCIVSTGIMVHRALEVAEELSKHRIDAAVVDLYRLKPVDEDVFLEVLEDFKTVVTLEENTIVGGIGSLVSEVLSDNQKDIPLKRIAIKDEQCFAYGTRDWLHKKYGIDRQSVVEQILIWNK